MFDLTGMTALVTGASGGIGSAIARGLAAQGARLAVSGSNAEKLTAFRASLGGDHVAVPADLSDPVSVDALVPAAVEALGGRLDILVNNAGITRDNLAMRMKDEEWRQVISVNLEAAFRLIRAAAKPMMKQRFGRVISITSIVGQTGNPGQANYAASKAGLVGMSKALAQEPGEPQHHGELRRPRLHPLGDDRRVAGSAEGCAARQDSRRRSRHGRGYRRRRGLSRVEGGGVRHRPDAARQRRDGDGVIPAKA